MVRRTTVFLCALGSGAALPPACSPQVVDVVEIAPDAGTGGSDGTGGTATGGTAGSGGAACPDRDGDGHTDCEDECPEDPKKFVEGICGCGLPNPPDVDGGAHCLQLAELLAHRYTFEGLSGSIAVIDSQVGANGAVVRTALSGDGTVTLAGEREDQYVDLPNNLLQESSSMTFEAWVRWDGGRAWQRIFDFGDNNAENGSQGDYGISYLFLTPRVPTDTVNPPLLQTGKMRLAYKRAASEPELTAEAPIALPSGGQEPTQVVVVIDSENRQMSLFVDGARQNGVAFVAGTPIIVNTAGPYDWGTPLADGTMPPPVDLSAINDVNNWLGRSQFIADDGFSGTYYEFRIYSGALTDELVEISFKGGPDPVFF